MGITKSTGYLDSAGVMHSSVKEAQRAELMKVFDIDVAANSNTDPRARIWNAEDIADKLLANADAILAILTTGPRTRTKARKVAGTTNPRRAARVSKPVAQAGFDAMRAAANALEAHEANKAAMAS